MDSVKSAESQWNSIYMANRPMRWWPSESLIRYVSQVFGQDGGKGLQALEIGCGTGRNLWFLAECGFSVYGIDVSNAALAYCESYMTQRNQSANVSLGQADITEGVDHAVYTAFGETKTFDLVVDDRTLQHTMMSEHLPIYTELRNTALNKNGRFFSQHLADNCTDMRYGVTSFIDECTAENITGTNTVFPDNGIVCMPPHNRLVELLQRAGLIVELAEQLYHMTISQNNETLVTHYSILGARA